jgi:hypothetical protein
MNCEYRRGRNVEGIDCDLIYDTKEEFAWRDQGKPRLNLRQNSLS